MIHHTHELDILFFVVFVEVTPHARTFRPSAVTTKYVVCSSFDLSISSASNEIKTPTASVWGQPTLSAKPHVSAICFQRSKSNRARAQQQQQQAVTGLYMCYERDMQGAKYKQEEARGAGGEQKEGDGGQGAAGNNNRSHHTKKGRHPQA